MMPSGNLPKVDPKALLKSESGVSPGWYWMFVYSATSGVNHAEVVQVQSSTQASRLREFVVQRFNKPEIPLTALRGSQWRFLPILPLSSATAYAAAVGDVKSALRELGKLHDGSLEARGLVLSASAALASALSVLDTQADQL